MQAAGCQQRLTSGASAFAGRPVRSFAGAQPNCSRRQVEVYAKGKQQMRRGGNRQQMLQMQQMMPPTPPVDPENEEFVVFIRSKMMNLWVPLSVVKGGPGANLLVKGMSTDLGMSALVSNIAKAVYKDKEQIINAVRKMPQFRATKQFEFAFKVRDKSKPKEWLIATNLHVLPPEEELDKTPAEKVGDFFGSIKKSISGLTGAGARS